MPRVKLERSSQQPRGLGGSVRRAKDGGEVVEDGCTLARFAQGQQVEVFGESKRPSSVRQGAELKGHVEALFEDEVPLRCSRDASHQGLDFSLV